MVSVKEARQYAKTVATVECGAIDGTGQVVVQIYAKSMPNYAVYRASRGVAVQYSDDPDTASEQRTRLAMLVPLRGEIAGLLEFWEDRDSAQNGWHRIVGRISGVNAAHRKILRYDRRVADALVVALEASTADGARLLEFVRDDLKADLSQASRLKSLGLTTLIVLVVAGASSAFLGSTLEYRSEAQPFVLATGTAAFGAFFSIAGRLRSRSETELRASLFDCVLRISVGIVAAIIVISLLESGIVTLGFGKVMIAGAELRPSWQVVAAIGFLAGFAERYVPDLLTKAAAGAEESSFPLASASAAALVDLRKILDSSVRTAVGSEIGATVREAIAGPELVQFDGFVSASLGRNADEELRTSLVLHFTRFEREGASRVLIARGSIQPTIDFVIECEPAASPADRTTTVVTIPTGSDHDTSAISVATPTGTRNLWVALRQGGRLIQTIEVPISDRRSSE